MATEPSRLRKSLGLQATAKSAITFVFVILIISSPFVVLINPTDAEAGSATSNANRVDSSDYHSTPRTVGTSLTPTPTAAMTPSTISQVGDGGFTAQAALFGPSTFRSTDIVSSKAVYEIIFVTATSGTIKKIDITFPAGTGISTAGFMEIVGIGPSTSSRTGNTLSLNVLNPVMVPAGTVIKLEIGDIANPSTPSTNYRITVTTRNSANAIIDGPTQSVAYLIKQIGSGDLANGAVTATKISPTFITSRVLKDDARGDTFGWNPDGSETNFILFDASILGSNAVLANVGDTGSNSQCESLGALTGFFTIQCSNPPPQGSELRYIVFNLIPA